MHTYDLTIRELDPAVRDTVKDFFAWCENPTFVEQMTSAFDEYRSAMEGDYPAEGAVRTFAVLIHDIYTDAVSAEENR